MSACGCDGERCDIPKGDPRHGTPNGYGNRKCRCAQCRRAWADARNRDDNRMRYSPVPREAHGTVTGWHRYSCRCELCRIALRQALARWNGGTLASRNHYAQDPATALRNAEIGRLVAGGMSIGDVAEKFDLAPATVSWIAHDPLAVIVRPETAARLAKRQLRTKHAAERRALVERQTAEAADLADQIMNAAATGRVQS